MAGRYSHSTRVIFKEYQGIMAVGEAEMFNDYLYRFRGKIKGAHKVSRISSDRGIENIEPWFRDALDYPTSGVMAGYEPWVKDISDKYIIIFDQEKQESDVVLNNIYYAKDGKFSPLFTSDASSPWASNPLEDSRLTDELLAGKPQNGSDSIEVMTGFSYYMFLSAFPMTKSRLESLSIMLYNKTGPAWERASRLHHSVLREIDESKSALDITYLSHNFSSNDVEYWKEEGGTIELYLCDYASSLVQFYEQIEQIKKNAASERESTARELAALNDIFIEGKNNLEQEKEGAEREFRTATDAYNTARNMKYFENANSGSPPPWYDEYLQYQEKSRVLADIEERLHFFDNLSDSISEEELTIYNEILHIIFIQHKNMVNQLHSDARNIFEPVLEKLEQYVTLLGRAAKLIKVFLFDDGPKIFDALHDLYEYQIVHQKGEQNLYENGEYHKAERALVGLIEHLRPNDADKTNFFANELKKVIEGINEIYDHYKFKSVLKEEGSEITTHELYKTIAAENASLCGQFHLLTELFLPMASKNDVREFVYAKMAPLGSDLFRALKEDGTEMDVALATNFFDNISGFNKNNPIMNFVNEDYESFIENVKNNKIPQKAYGAAVSGFAFWLSVKSLENNDTIEAKLQFLSATASLSSGLIELLGPSSQVITQSMARSSMANPMLKRYVGQSIIGYRLTAVDYILAAAADGVMAYKRYKDCDYDSAIAFTTAASLALASYFISNPAIASAVLATSVGAGILGGILTDSDIRTWLKYSYYGKDRQESLTGRRERNWTHYSGWHHITQQIADFNLIPYSEISLESPQILRPFANEVWPLREPDLPWTSLDIDLRLPKFNYRTTSVYFCLSIDSVFLNRYWPIELDDEEKQFFRQELTPEDFILAEKNDSDKEEICFSLSLKPTSRPLLRRQKNAFYLTKSGFRTLQRFLADKASQMELPDIIRQSSQEFQIDLQLQFFILPEKEKNKEEDKENKNSDPYDINTEEGHNRINQYAIKQKKIVKGLRL